LLTPYYVLEIAAGGFLENTQLEFWYYGEQVIEYFRLDGFVPQPFL
jgi:hypothetical protein